MHIAFLSHYVTAYRLPMLRALATRVRRLSIVLSSAQSTPELHHSGLEVIELPGWQIPRRRRHPDGFVETYHLHLPRGVHRTLRALAPDVMHAHELGLRTLAAMAYRRTHGRPLVVHADLSEQTEQGRGLARNVLRPLLMRQIDRVAVNGHSGQRYIESLGFPADRIDRLPFATDTTRFGARRAPGPVDAPRRLLYVGRLIALKGLDVLIRRLAAVLQRRPEVTVTFRIVGTGDVEAALRAIAVPANLKIDWAGAVDYDHLAGEYQRADCLVFPTWCDTWGLVVNEAMASGLPVLSSRFSQAGEELVRPAVNGWLYDPRSEAQTDEAIAQMLDTPHCRWQPMSEAAHQAAMAIGPEAVADMLEQSCRRAIEARQRPGTRRVSGAGETD